MRSGGKGTGRRSACHPNLIEMTGSTWQHNMCLFGCFWFVNPFKGEKSWSDPGFDVRHARSRSDARLLTQDTQGPSSQGIKSPKRFLRSKCWTSVGFLSFDFFSATKWSSEARRVKLSREPTFCLPRQSLAQQQHHQGVPDLHHLHSQVRSRVCPMTYDLYN